MNDWVIRLIEQSGYLGIGFLMFLETVFPADPVRGDHADRRNGGRGRAS